MERTRFDGFELEYELSGDGEPAVFIHGAFVADAFRPLLSEPALTSRHRLLLYHRRGYAGSSPATGPPGISREAADCRALLSRLGIERAHVVGHSFGGAVALQLALDAPDRIQTLTLVEPALMAGESGAGYRESLTRGIEGYRHDRAERIVDEFLEARTPGCRGLLDRVLPGAFAQAVSDAGTVFESDLPSLLEWRFGEAEARQVTQPTLSVLGGESNALWARFGEVHQLLIEWLPSAEGAVLPGTTHFLQIEDPPGTADLLAGFWSRHPVTAGND